MPVYDLQLVADHPGFQVKALHAIQQQYYSSSTASGTRDAGTCLRGLGYSNKRRSAVAFGRSDYALVQGVLAAVVVDHPQLDKFAGSCG